jgi:hypothetical protein
MVTFVHAHDPGTCFLWHACIVLWCFQARGNLYMSTVHQLP